MNFVVYARRPVEPTPLFESISIYIIYIVLSSIARGSLGSARVRLVVPWAYTTFRNRPYSHKLLTINNYVNCLSNFAFARSIYLFHPPIFEKILMRIRSIHHYFWWTLGCL